MAKKFIWIDGYASRHYTHEWPGGAGSEVPQGSPHTVDRPHVFPNEGRYFNQAGGGTHSLLYGSGHWISLPEIDTAYPWIQMGMWLQWKSIDLDLTRKRISMNGLRQSSSDGSDMFNYPGAHWGIGLTSPNVNKLGVFIYNPISFSIESNYTTDKYWYPENNRWYWVEWRCDNSLAAGTAELRIDGVQAFRMTGIKTGPGGTNYSAFSFPIFEYYEQSEDYRTDDMYCILADSEGELDWYGQSVAEALVPSGTGDHSGFTPTSGVNYAAVDELPAVDTDFVSDYTNTNGIKDSYQFTDLDTSRARTIRGLKVTVRARRNNSGTRKIRPFCKISGTIYYGITQHVGCDWREYMHIWEVNPATAAAWTASAVNSAQFGFEQVS